MLHRIRALRDDLPKVQNDWRSILAMKQRLFEVRHSDPLSQSHFDSSVRARVQLNAAT
jgi:hypothetical protein